MQSTFSIFSQSKFKSIPAQPVAGMQLHVKENKWSRDYESITAICITTKDFDAYKKAAYSLQDGYLIIENAADINKYSIKDMADIDEYDELMPFEDAIQSLVFIEGNMEQSGQSIYFTISKVHNTAALLQYWIKQNTFTNTRQLQHIGLGPAIYNALPPHHNYFGMCWVCTCGQSQCYNYMAWYIRYAESFSVGFIINYYSTLELNAQETSYQEEDYEEFIADKNEADAHNKRLQQIKLLLANDESTTLFDTLSQADKAILEEGEESYFFPCLYEHEDFCLYQPLLASNQMNPLL